MKVNNPLPKVKLIPSIDGSGFNLHTSKSEWAIKNNIEFNDVYPVYCITYKDDIIVFIYEDYKKLERLEKLLNYKKISYKIHYTMFQEHAKIVFPGIEIYGGFKGPLVNFSKNRAEFI